MAQRLREKAMQEVAESAKSVRPAGISHVLRDGAHDPVKRLAEIRDANRMLAEEREHKGLTSEDGGPHGKRTATRSRSAGQCECQWDGARNESVVAGCGDG